MNSRIVESNNIVKQFFVTEKMNGRDLFICTYKWIETSKYRSENLHLIYIWLIMTRVFLPETRIEIDWNKRIQVKSS